MGSSLFAGQTDWQLILTALMSTLLLAWLTARFARRLAATGFRALVDGSLVPGNPLLRGPLRVVFLTTLALVVGLLLFPALDVAGLRPLIGRDGQEIADWLFGPGLRVVLIALVAYALVRATDLLVRRLELEMPQGTALDDLERAKRARTLVSVVRKITTGLVLGTASVVILNEIGFNVGPVLTGAGIAGIAVGFGAQTLVRDFLSGFFLLLEDQVRVGDVAAINGTNGLVEQLNLRTIVLRDIRGTLHVFPNGGITTLANHSKDFSRYVIDLDLSYEEDPDRVSDIAREVDRELRNDPQFEPLMLEPVEILGVIAFTEWSIQLRIRMKTVAQRQWLVGREFRKRLRKALRRHGIEVPYPALRPPP